MEILEVTTEDQVAIARRLFEEYRQTPGVSECVAGFAEEVHGLPAPYAPPAGVLLLGMLDGEPAGCAGLRPLEPGICEMKRLYVRPAARRSGMARAMVLKILGCAGALGYGRMRLDTLPTMESARKLYESLGFARIAPYGPRPIQHAIHMEIRL